MVTREILNSHPIKNLKLELSKVKKSLNYGKLKKSELVDLMMKNKEFFNHIEKYKKPTPAPKPAPKPAPAPAPKPKTKKAETKPKPKPEPPKNIKIWSGMGELPNFGKTDNFSVFKFAWERKGFKVEKKEQPTPKQKKVETKPKPKVNMSEDEEYKSYYGITTSKPKAKSNNGIRDFSNDEIQKVMGKSKYEGFLKIIKDKNVKSKVIYIMSLIRAFLPHDWTKELIDKIGVENTFKSLALFVRKLTDKKILYPLSPGQMEGKGLPKRKLFNPIYDFLKKNDGKGKEFLNNINKD